MLLTFMGSAFSRKRGDNLQDRLLHLLQIPLSAPILVFLCVLTIILVIPLFMQKIRVPSIIGLIAAGVAVGPHGLNLLARNSAIILFGTIGLLYIMFLAALELDLDEFKRNRNRSLVFGALTFSIPLCLGLVVCKLFLHFDWLAAVLVSSMFATHTLIAYPIASRLGLTRNEAVTIAVGGTIITDVAVLLVLAVITGVAQGSLTLEFWLQMGVSLLAFALLVLWAMPRLGAWFFRTIEGDQTSHYLFVLTMVFLAAFLAELAGVEAIIGAFLSGLALNRLIPHSSTLMNRIEFVGQSLFIPFFLVSVGMLVDLRVVTRGWDALIVAVTLTVCALAGKWLAAWMTQKLFHYSPDQRGLLFGLSSAHAAATLAVILTGYEMKIVDENVLNGTILLILITCFAGSIAAERSGLRLATLEGSRKASKASESHNRILVALKNEATLGRLLDLALMLKHHPKDQLHALSVVEDNEQAQEGVFLSHQLLEKATRHASAAGTQLERISRVDLSTPSGIAHAAKELDSSHIIVGWNARLRPSEMIFGSVLQRLQQQTWQMLLVSKIQHPLNTMQKIVIAVPAQAEFEKGFPRWIETIHILAKQMGARLHFFAAPEAIGPIQQTLQSLHNTSQCAFSEFDDWEDFLILAREVSIQDLLVVIAARRQTVSYDPQMERILPKLNKHFAPISFLLIYPEQFQSSSQEVMV
jgi:Kef-type K+ transport system membrane component KefB